MFPLSKNLQALDTTIYTVRSVGHRQISLLKQFKMANLTASQSLLDMIHLLLLIRSSRKTVATPLICRLSSPSQSRPALWVVNHCWQLEKMPPYHLKVVVAEASGFSLAVVVEGSLLCMCSLAILVLENPQLLNQIIGRSRYTQWMLRISNNVPLGKQKADLNSRFAEWEWNLISGLIRNSWGSAVLEMLRQLINAVMEKQRGREAKGQREMYLKVVQRNRQIDTKLNVTAEYNISLHIGKCEDWEWNSISTSVERFWTESHYLKLRVFAESLYWNYIRAHC